MAGQGTGTQATQPTGTGQKTALQIVNAVQRDLKFPQTPQSNFGSDPSAQLVLSYINTVMRDFMSDPYIWDALKLYGSFNTIAHDPLLVVAFSGNMEIDTVLNLQIGTSPPIEQKDDDYFRAYKRAHGTESQPCIYRIRSKTAASWVIELSPTPDKVYQIDHEILQKQPPLAAYNDSPLVDSDTVILGAIWWARLKQGRDASGELAVFQAKLGASGENEGNTGDVEVV